MFDSLWKQGRQAVAGRLDGLFADRYLKGDPSKLASDPDQIEARLRWLDRIAQRYQDPALYHEPSTFFPHPDPIAPHLQQDRARGHTDLWWPSLYEPWHGPEIAGRYMDHDHNHTARARLWAEPASEGRPAVILVHGYRGGVLPVEQLLWPIDRWRGAGFDVALLVLPHHGSRKIPRASRPFFPHFDPRLTIEGVRQSVHDVRGLAGWLRGRGAGAVGVCGMSLGGFVSSLLISVAPELDFAIPLVPLASFADWGDDHDTLLGQGEQRRRHHAALEAVTRPIDPTARAPQIDPERLAVIAGRADRVNAVHHARRIADHTGAELVLFDGGHLLQFGVAEATERVARSLPLP